MPRGRQPARPPLTASPPIFPRTSRPRHRSWPESPRPNPPQSAGGSDRARPHWPVTAKEIAMNPQPQPQSQSPALVQVRAADALIAVVPYLLGFHPEPSLAVLALSRSDSRVRLAFRVALP